jgi:hypothetical protein
MGAQVDAVTVQAEELARTAGQLQDLVMRFHAEVGTDAAIEATYAGDYQKADVVLRRRGGDWSRDHSGHGYESRAS